VRIGLDGMLLGGHHSGVEHAIEGLVGALPEVGPQHEYTMVMTTAYAASLVQESRPSASVHVRAAPPFVHGRLLRILYEQTRLAGKLRDCDLLHSPAYVMPLNWRGPSVLTVYDVIALTHPDLCKRTNVWHYGRMLPASLRRASAIVVPTETVARDVRALVPEAGERLHVIPLGLDARFRPADPETVAHVRTRYGLPEHYLLCVGNIEPKKNLPAVLRAFDEVAATLPHHLVVVGRRGWKCGEFDRVLAHMRARDRVHLVGYAAGEDLPALYTGAAVLVQWSLVEGMGLPPLEAMSCGTAAVVSDGGALPETVGTTAEVVPLGPPQQLAEALLRLLPDQARLAALRQAGREHAAQFTWQRHARGVVALYEETLHEQS